MIIAAGWLPAAGQAAGGGPQHEHHELVGLTDVAGRKVGGFSLGMRQRLGLAAALLGDPPVLVLDEPANGLDPAGTRWLRDLLRGLANDRRTVLVSSHVLPEVEMLVGYALALAAVGSRLTLRRDLS